MVEETEVEIAPMGLVYSGFACKHLGGWFPMMESSIVLLRINDELLS